MHHFIKKPSDSPGPCHGRQILNNFCTVGTTWLASITQSANAKYKHNPISLSILHSSKEYTAYT